jgi:hypothetical protein
MTNIATTALGLIEETKLDIDRILKEISSKANFSRYPSANKFHRNGQSFKSQKRRSNNRKRNK